MENRKELNDELLNAVTGGSKENYEALTAEVLSAFATVTTKEQLDELTGKYMQLAGKKLGAGELTGQEALMMFIPWISNEYDKVLNQLKDKA